MDKTVLIVLTPFHAKQAYKLLESDEFVVMNLFIFYSTFVDLEYLRKTFPLAEYQPIPDGTILVSAFKGNFVSEFRKTDLIIKSYFSCIKSFLKNESGSFTLISGSDKDLFNQIFYNEATKLKLIKKLVFLDEGLGVYRSRSRFSQIRNWVYQIISPIIFGHKFRFVEVLGTDSRIDVSYIRDISLLQVRNKKIKYKPFPKEISYSEKSNSEERKVLILTRPFSEDLLLDRNYESKTYTTVIKSFLSKGYQVDLKPHPREIVGKLEIDSDKLKILPLSLPAEDLNYFDYGVIVHFESSVILDVVLNGFPVERTLHVFRGPINPFSNFKIESEIINMANEDIELKVMDFIKNLR